MRTPHESYPELAKAIGVPAIYFKREDMHPYESHKGRSIPHMIDTFVQNKHKNFCISSSGNAALAAAHYIIDQNKKIKKYNKKHKKQRKYLTLTIFCGKNIDIKKLSKIKSLGNTHIFTEMVERPKQKAFMMEKEGAAINLRQSTNDHALIGYYDLAAEMSKIPQIEALFIPTSSGTTLLGISEGLEKQFHHIALHPVQTSKCHPIAEHFDSSFAKEETSLAGAIVDIVSKRKKEVIDATKKSLGFGWVISNKELKEAEKLVKEHCSLDLSYNSLLSVAGVIKAKKAGWRFIGSVACLITGR